MIMRKNLAYQNYLRISTICGYVGLFDPCVVNYEVVSKKLQNGVFTENNIIKLSWHWMKSLF